MLAALLGKLCGVRLLEACGILWSAMRYLLPDPLDFSQRGSDRRLTIVKFLKCGCEGKAWSLALIQ